MGRCTCSSARSETLDRPYSFHAGTETGSSAKVYCCGLILNSHGDSGADGPSQSDPVAHYSLDGDNVTHVFNCGGNLQAGEGSLREPMAEGTAMDFAENDMDFAKEIQNDMLVAFREHDFLEAGAVSVADEVLAEQLRSSLREVLGETYETYDAMAPPLDPLETADRPLLREDLANLVRMDPRWGGAAISRLAKWVDHFTHIDDVEAAPWGEINVLELADIFVGNVDYTARKVPEFGKEIHRTIASALDAGEGEQLPRKEKTDLEMKLKELMHMPNLRSNAGKNLGSVFDEDKDKFFKGLEKLVRADRNLGIWMFVEISMSLDEGRDDLMDAFKIDVGSDESDEDSGDVSTTPENEEFGRLMEDFGDEFADALEDESSTDESDVDGPPVEDESSTDG